MRKNVYFTEEELIAMLNGQSVELDTGHEKIIFQLEDKKSKEE